MSFGVGQTAETLLQQGHIEVDQQSDVAVRQLQIGEQLGGMERVQVFDYLDLDDESLIDQDVQPVATRERDAFVAHWHGDLTSERQSAQAQLMTKALFIRRFEEARPKTPVNFDRCADDLL